MAAGRRREMKGMGFAVFSESASPVPGYDFSRIITDIKQSQEMKLTHAKLHYSRVRSPAAQDSWCTVTRAARKSCWLGAEPLLCLAQPVPRGQETCSSGGTFCSVCPRLSLLSAPHDAFTRCKAKLETCQQAPGLACRADA